MPVLPPKTRKEFRDLIEDAAARYFALMTAMQHAAVDCLQARIGSKWFVEWCESGLPGVQAATNTMLGVHCAIILAPFVVCTIKPADELGPSDALRIARTVDGLPDEGSFDVRICWRSGEWQVDAISQAAAAGNGADTVPNDDTSDAEDGAGGGDMVPSSGEADDIARAGGNNRAAKRVRFG
jgi:hypothetical protein